MKKVPSPESVLVKKLQQQMAHVIDMMEQTDDLTDEQLEALVKRSLVYYGERETNP